MSVLVYFGIRGVVRAYWWKENCEQSLQSIKVDPSDLITFGKLWSNISEKPERKDPSREFPLCQGGLAGCTEMMVQPGPSQVMRTLYIEKWKSIFCIFLFPEYYVLTNGTHPRHVNHDQLFDALKKFHGSKCWKTGSLGWDLKSFINKSDCLIILLSFGLLLILNHLYLVGQFRSPHHSDQKFKGPSL